MNQQQLETLKQKILSHYGVAIKTSPCSKLVYPGTWRTTFSKQIMIDCEVGKAGYGDNEWEAVDNFAKLLEKSDVTSYDDIKGRTHAFPPFSIAA